jgi:hypothetical protein
MCGARYARRRSNALTGVEPPARADSAEAGVVQGEANMLTLIVGDRRQRRSNMGGGDAPE